MAEGIAERVGVGVLVCGFAAEKNCVSLPIKLDNAQVGAPEALKHFLLHYERAAARHHLCTNNYGQLFH